MVSCGMFKSTILLVGLFALAGASLRSFNQSLLLETVSETTANASIGDLNGDGNLDIVLAKGRHWALPDVVLFGDGKGHYLVVLTLADTDYVCDYMRNGGDKSEFLEKFRGGYSPGFDPDIHLQTVGVANQTTMLRGETEEVQRRVRQAISDRDGPESVERNFRFFDTICGATQERQDALRELLNEKMDLLLVVGGYNSSNTSHLAEMGEEELPTYFVLNSSRLVSREEIKHYDLHEKREVISHFWMPPGRAIVGITAGASCPNNLIEETLIRLFELRGIPRKQLELAA